MLRTTKAKVLPLVTALAACSLAVVGVVHSGPATANTGYPVCVAAGTPVKTGPGGTTTYTMNAQQAWHVYTEEANQWTQGYVSRTDPVQRGWVWGGHFDYSRTPIASPSGGDYCP
ncbi:MAG: hypothetical protein QOE23_3798 [Pseudonocardiales bacterium]|nr:hypothetical protein [Pseudonocardiales bacterium]